MNSTLAHRGFENRESIKRKVFVQYIHAGMRKNSKVFSGANRRCINGVIWEQQKVANNPHNGSVK